MIFWKLRNTPFLCQPRFLHCTFKCLLNFTIYTLYWPAQFNLVLISGNANFFNGNLIKNWTLIVLAYFFPFRIKTKRRMITLQFNAHYLIWNIIFCVNKVLILFMEFYNLQKRSTKDSLIKGPSVNIPPTEINTL